jgi:hypothetical protein
MNLHILVRDSGHLTSTLVATVLCAQSMILNAADTIAPAKIAPDKSVELSNPAYTAENSVKSQQKSVPSPAVRDVISDSKLSALMAASPKIKDFLSANTKPVGDDRPKPDESAFSRSIILYDGTNFTLIPEGSILTLPANLREHVVASPLGSFLLWPSFLKQNAKWLASREVTMEMALGDKEASAEILQSLKADTKLRVAVYRSNPISVMEKPDTTPGASK